MTRFRLINRNYTYLFYGQLVSSLGDYVFDTTLSLWIATVLLAGKSYAPAAVSGVLVAVSAATFLVGPIAGVFVDRWDKRRTMLAADLIRASVIAVLIAVALLPRDALPVPVMLAAIYLVVFVNSAVSQFFGPSRMALIGRIVPGDEARAKAAGWSQAAMYGAAIVGPPLAAPLLFTFGDQWALVLDMLSFLASYLLVRRITVPAPTAAEPAAPSPMGIGGVVADLRSGLRVVAGNRTVRTLIVAIVVLTLGTGALNALLVFFVPDNLHADSSWYGLLGMGEGIGGVVGSLVAGRFCRRFGDIRVLCTGLILVGAGVMVFARLGSLWPAVLTLALLGLPMGAVNVALSPILLRATPADYLGRTIAVINPSQQLASIVATLTAGWLASTVLHGFDATALGLHFGRIDLIFLVSGVLFVCTGAYTTWSLRDTAGAPRREPEPVDAAPGDN